METVHELHLLGDLSYKNKKIGYLVKIVRTSKYIASFSEWESRDNITTFIAPESLKILKKELGKEGIYINDSKVIINIKNFNIDTTYVTYENNSYTQYLLAYLRREYKNCYASDLKEYPNAECIGMINKDIELQASRLAKEKLYYEKAYQTNHKYNLLINLMSDYNSKEDYIRFLNGDKPKKYFYFTSFRRTWDTKDFIVGVRRYTMELESKPKKKIGFLKGLH